jgi:hypothetical protein
MSSSSPLLSSPIAPDSPNGTKSPETITIAPRDRSRGRTVHIYNAETPATAIGGLILTHGVTNASLYSMVEILVLFTSTFELHDENEATMQRNDEPLQPGKYYVHAVGKFLHVIVSLSWVNLRVLDRHLRD